MATRARVDSAATDPTRGKSPRDCAAADFLRDPQPKTFCARSDAQNLIGRCRQDLRISWGVRQSRRRALRHPRRLRSTDRHGLLRQRQRREGDRGASPPITRPRDPPRTRGNPRAARGQFSLTVFQTGKPRRKFDRSWRAVVAGDGAWIASRTRRRRPRAKTTPRIDGFASFPRARAAHEARRSGRSDPTNRPARCQQRRGGVAVISRRFNLDPDRAPPRHVSAAHREAQVHRCPLLHHLRRLLGRHVHHRRHRAVPG